VTAARSRALAGAALLVACGSAGPLVRTDETSVAGHRREAARERTAAEEDRQPVRTIGNELGRPIGAEPTGWPATETPRYDPTRASEAEWHLAHARAHETAALELERFEASECTGIETRERAGCPLVNHVRRIDDVPLGVLVTLDSPPSAEALARRMRCHYAFARARGFTADAAACPLYVRGLDIRASDGGVRIVGPDARTAERIRRLVRLTSLPSVR
jgi:hypothetical protein